MKGREMRKLLTLFIGTLVLLLLAGCAGEAKKEAPPVQTEPRMTATAPSFNPELEKAMEIRKKIILELVRIRAEQQGIVLDENNPEDPFNTKQ